MQIHPDQVAQEVRVDDASSLVKLLKDEHAIKDPKVILVFDSNKGASDENKHKWKVHVFYHSPTVLEDAKLNVDVVLRDTRLMARDKEVIKTIYPDGYVGWCGIINAQKVWIT